MDSNLLKEAIADAKAVRQTALANAKVALEEAFTERYSAMLSEKLKEDVGSQFPEEDGIGRKASGFSSNNGEFNPENGNVTESEIDELIRELEGEVSDDPNAPQPPAPAPMTPPAGDGTMPPPAEDDQTLPTTNEGEMDEEVNLEALLESLKEELECEEKEDNEPLDEVKKLSSSSIGGKSENKKPSGFTSSGLESGGIKKHGFPDQGGTKVGPCDATKATRPNSEKVDSTPKLGGTSGPALKAARPNSKGEFENTTKLHEQNTNLKSQLDEAVEVIKYVKGQLNEVNLLNAKLLYTNKLFKEYVMNNDNKMRIVEMFDLAQTVREVKLTYANIAESLNFGGNDMKKKAITNSSVTSITEGLASKPVGSTKPSRGIISEGTASEMVTKFQKLAGIKRS